MTKILGDGTFMCTVLAQGSVIFTDLLFLHPRDVALCDIASWGFVQKECVKQDFISM